MTSRIDATSIKNTISPHLAKDESVLWYGQPDAIQAAMPMMPLILFGLVFLGASSIFLFAALIGKGANQWIPAFFGIPGALVGLFLMAIPINGCIQASRTLYVATSKRLIITDERFSNSTQSFPLQNLASVTRTTSGTKGTLVWDLIAANSSNSRTSGSATSVQLIGIEDPLSVQHIIEEQMFEFRENV